MTRSPAAPLETPRLPQGIDDRHLPRLVGLGSDLFCVLTPDGGFTLTI